MEHEQDIFFIQTHNFLSSNCYCVAINAVNYVFEEITKTRNNKNKK